MEGADLVTAGVAAGHRPQIVFVRAERAAELAALLGAAGGPAASGAAAPADGPPPAVYPVEERVARRLSTLETPPDVLAVFPLPQRPPLAALRDAAAEGPLLVYADGIGDPGNMGTLLRAAVAFGATAMATASGSADVYGPKTVRASMGAVFGLSLWPELPLGDLLEQLPAAEVYGLAAHGGAPLPAAGLRRPAVLVVGAERPGLSAQTLAHVTRLLTIPLAPARPGAVESLNAGVAGAIALYEFSRRPAGAFDDPPRRAAVPEEG